MQTELQKGDRVIQSTKGQAAFPHFKKNIKGAGVVVSIVQRAGGQYLNIKQDGAKTTGVWHPSFWQKEIQQYA